MLSRWTYVERGGITAALAIAPWLAAGLADTGGGSAEFHATLIRFAVIAPLLAAVGAGLAVWLQKTVAIRGIEWGGYDETAALLKQAGSELVTGKPDDKLFSSANKQADNQDGRATGIYLFTRMAQLRQTDSFRRRAQPNPIPLLKRLIWLVILGATAGLILAWPSLLEAKLPLVTRVIVIAIAAPLFVTGVLICGVGLRSADAWLYRVAGLRMPQRSTVKLRKREIKSAAGQWHKQPAGPDVPMFRVMFGVIALIAITLYVLREYDDAIFGSEPIVADGAGLAEAQPAPLRPEPTATPVPRVTPAPRARSRPAATPVPPQVPLAEIWSRLNSNGTLIDADRGALNYAGWDLDTLRQEFASYKRERLDEWYIQHLRENPHDLGKVAFRLTLQPYGGVSDIQLLASQIGDSAFTNGLIDRLDAIQLGGAGLDSVSITLAYDFRL